MTLRGKMMTDYNDITYSFYDFYLKPSDITLLINYGVTFIAILDYHFSKGPFVSLTKLSPSSNFLTTFESKENLFSLYNELVNHDVSVLQKGTEKILVLKNKQIQGHAKYEKYLLVGFQSSIDDVLWLKPMFKTILEQIQKHDNDLSSLIHENLSKIKSPKKLVIERPPDRIVLNSPRVRHSLIFKHILGLFLYDEKRSVLDVRSLPQIINQISLPITRINEFVDSWLQKEVSSPLFHHEYDFTYYIIPPHQKSSLWLFVVIDEAMVLDKDATNIFSAWFNTLHSAFEDLNLQQLPQELVTASIHYIESNLKYLPTLHDRKILSFLLQANHLTLDAQVPLDIIPLFYHQHDALPIESLLLFIQKSHNQNIKDVSYSMDIPIHDLLSICYQLYLRKAINLFKV